MIRALVLAALLLAFAGAGAQMRSIPDDAKRAQIRHVQDMLVELDGATARLAAGALIYDAENRTIVPSAIPGGARARYLLNAQGEVRRIWLLSPAEAAQARRNWN